MIPDDNATTEVFGSLSPFVTVDYEPVGRWFEAHYRRLQSHGQHGQSEHSISSSSESEEEEEADQFDEENESLFLTLDPKEWKKQDHYVILGLSKLRYKASEDQIKRAYKQKVLTHHPDKRKAHGKAVKEGDDDYFSCITKAYEILGNKQKRRSFDSVDPEFDAAIPSVNQASKDNFYSIFRPAFERNARWSLKKRVPKLGDKDTPFEDVDHFYSFWYDFDSWREFSYLDEEEKEKGENRDERRWIEKQNKAARQKRKKEEMMRIRQLVDNGYTCDPRILKHNEEEKERKNAIKKAKQEAARLKAEEEERKRQEALEEERSRKEKEEQEAKAKAALAKKERDALKKQTKKEKETMRSLVKGFDYFAQSDRDRLTMMKETEKLVELLPLLSLQSLNECLKSDDKEVARTGFLNKVKEVNDENEKEKRAQLESLQQKSSGHNSGVTKTWSEEEVHILIKAVNLFPAGTQNRWEVIANFISQHVSGSNKNAKDVLAKAKELQKNDGKLKEDTLKNAYSKFELSHKAAKSGDMEKPSERLETVGEQQVRETGSNQAAWTAEEQKLLEQALKSYPSSDSERWDKISSVIPSRSKRDCMKRYKELCELVKAKKQAQSAVAAKKKS